MAVTLALVAIGLALAWVLTGRAQIVHTIIRRHGGR